ncbi:MAG: class I SAM-dependent methyltransferase [Patescibacteria group bacterium]|nr:class I SAM-dependent methyltransferase [Patescibacteria group bacterium]
MTMRLSILAAALCCHLICLQGPAVGQSPGAPKDLQSEADLPSRYPHVVRDIVAHCKPKAGFWVDLGAGRGQLTVPLVEATGNPVIMLDPNESAMAEGLKLAREKGLENRLFAVVGVAEQMPLPNDSVDLLVSRGSIFFWDDAAKGLAEVYRVLRPGGKAYIGGGAGSTYPAWAAEKLVQGRTDRLAGDNAERWKRFVELRRPEQMRQWAEGARLPNYKVMGKGAISANDPDVGQGVWLLIEKQ